MTSLNPFLIESYNFSIYGKTGTGKTTAALAGPGRKAYMELDIGSLQRAASSMAFEWESLDYYTYRLPPTSLRDRGKVSTFMVGKEGKGAATIVHTLKGWEGLADRFTNEFADFCEDYKWIDNPLYGEPNQPQRIKVPCDVPYTAIIVDTGTLAWDLLQDGTREQIQANLPQDQWEKELKRLEFEEPNMQIWDMCNWAKANRKNLIFTSMEAYTWNNSGPSPGYDLDKHKADGNKYLPGYVDIEMRMTIERQEVWGELTKTAAGGPELLGMKIKYPNVPGIIKLLNNVAMYKREGIPLPKPLTYESMTTD